MDICFDAFKTEEEILQVSGLGFSYKHGVRPVFSNVSFSLKQGEVLTILGPNGAGKSTLLNCIGSLLEPEAGCVRLAGKNIREFSARKIAQILGYVFQMQDMSFDYSVRDYLVLGRAPHIGYLKTPGDAEYQKVDEVLHELRIEYLAAKSVRQISGGERQQVQIARVLVQEPRIILLDEPTNHLDYGNQLKILQAIVDLAQKKQMTVILTSHTPDHAIMLRGKTGILDRRGSFVIGATDEIVTEENLAEIYQAELHMVYIDCVDRNACIAGNLQKS
jgi:iron complex transport system ATP-binding protein